VKRWLISIVVLWASVARAQSTDVLQPAQVTQADCLALDTTPGALMEPAPAPGELAMPIPWTEFAVEGELVDASATVHALLDPTMQQYRTSLTAKTWSNIAAATAKFGYQLVGHHMDDTRIVLHLAPLPVVRNVRVEVHQGTKAIDWLRGIFSRPLDDEIRRRMRVRTDSLLPWESQRRQCAMREEQARIEEYLRDEGFFDASATVLHAPDPDDPRRMSVLVSVELGPVYYLGKTTIVPGPNQLAIPDAEIAAVFHHESWCVLGSRGCLSGRKPFSRAQYQQDLVKLKEKFQKRGYPSVRIQSSVSSSLPGSFDRRTHLVTPTLVIDQRRHTDVQFIGIDNEGIKEEQLGSQLTFADAGSADDVEAVNSARAIQAYLQTRGYFDARVTWTRERFEIFDKITFRVDVGVHRDTTAVQFVGNQALKTEELEGIVATKPISVASDLLGTTTTTTSDQLATDIDRIVQAYRRAGYRETRVSVSASPAQIGLDDPATTAALLSLGRGSDLYVRYTIDEGKPTMLTRIVLEHADKGKQLDPEVCGDVLQELSTELNLRFTRDGCTATLSVPFREDDVLATHDRVRDFLFRKGRPRAIVDYTTIPTADHEVTAHYAIRGLDKLRIGKIIIRGNFRTKSSVIRNELDQATPKFGEGALLTADGLADAARHLRTTALFSAVNIELPDLGTDSSVVNAVVHVEERYDYTAQVELGVGGSTYNGVFGTATMTDANILGRGINLTVLGTYGTKLKDLEGTLRIPPWLFYRWSPSLQGRITQQDTPRFGLLLTQGFTTEIARQWIRPRSDKHTPQSKTLAFHYDFRLRSRNIDALRPIGPDQDDSQVAVSTRTGSFGVTGIWEHRLDRNGQLAPLAAEDGFRLEGSLSYASPALLGQDTFIKVSAAGSKFFAIGKNLTLRGDLRYDQGFPLGGAALLPEVERFYAGGDNTVRGYADDRLATEVIQVGVPPVAGISQIRVNPAGGNIRMLGSVDAQVRIWKILAGAMFADAGMITNQWGSVTLDDIRPSVGMGLRALTPFGIGALEYAIPIRPQLGDDPRGRIHFYFAARAQF
jgi:outer membrane protein assembly complex protein YaeT